jgi:hypothetical protein
MARLACLCGSVLSDSTVPNEMVGVLIKDQDVDLDCCAADVGRIVWECNACGRLAISYPAKHGIDVKWYVPEDGVPGLLMAFSVDSEE